MMILAWYTLAMMVAAVLFGVGNNKTPGGARIIGVLLHIPIIIFAVRYLLQ